MQGQSAPTKSGSPSTDSNKQRLIRKDQKIYTKLQCTEGGKTADFFHLCFKYFKIKQKRVLKNVNLSILKVIIPIILTF